MKKILVFIAIFAIAFGALAQEVTKGTFTDPRDGHVYPTITITFDDYLLGETTWFAENLDYKTNSGCWAYDNNSAYRKKLGLLYTWYAAKNACPDGWHLPSDAEWQTLIDYFGGHDKAGIALKSTQGWKSADESVKGTNSSGFSALPGGYRSSGNGTFGYVGNGGYWWSATESSGTIAWERELDGSSAVAYRVDYGKSGGFSVRCVRD